MKKAITLNSKNIGSILKRARKKLLEADKKRRISSLKEYRRINNIL